MCFGYTLYKCGDDILQSYLFIAVPAQTINFQKPHDYYHRSVRTYDFVVSTCWLISYLLCTQAIHILFIFASSSFSCSISFLSLRFRCICIIRRFRYYYYYFFFCVPSSNCNLLAAFQLLGSLYRLNEVIIYSRSF